MWVIIEKLAHEKISRILRKKSCDVIALSSNVTLLCDVKVWTFDVNTYNIQSRLKSLLIQIIMNGFTKQYSNQTMRIQLAQ